MKKIFAATVVWIFLIPSPANAHAQFTSTFPKSKSVVKVWPSTVWVEFDGNLIDIKGATVNVLTVKDSSGRQVDVKDSAVSGSRLTVSTPRVPKPGVYKVSWRVVSEDGHPVSSGFSFSYIPKK